MKRFLFLIALLVCFYTNAMADVVTATVGDRNNSNVYRLSASRDSNNNGYLTYAADSGIKYPYLESTTNLTLASYQAGIIIGVYPSQNNTAFTLPTAVPGLDYLFISGKAGATWKIVIQSTDFIAFAGQPAGGGTGIVNSSAAQGDQIELFCIFTGQWLVRDKTGTWTAGN